MIARAPAATLEHKGNSKGGRAGFSMLWSHYISSLQSRRQIATAHWVVLICSEILLPSNILLPVPHVCRLIQMVGTPRGQYPQLWLESRVCSGFTDLTCRPHWTACFSRTEAGALHCESLTSCLLHPASIYVHRMGSIILIERTIVCTHTCVTERAWTIQGCETELKHTVNIPAPNQHWAG